MKDATMEKSELKGMSFELYDLMACNVYWDFGEYPGGKCQHKYLFAVAAPPNGFDPICVEKIVAYGPNGFQTEIANERFVQKTANGYIHDARFGNYWYMKNMRGHFMEAGEHVIEVTFKNGKKSSISRIQDGEASDALYHSYLEAKPKIKFSPTSTLPAGTDLSKVEASWTSLKSLGGIDAFYIFRLAKAERSDDFDIQNLTWWDNVFVKRLTDPMTGQNKDRILIEETLEHDTGYGWWVEVTDSNRMGGSNLCCFQPVQLFRTP